MTTRIALSYAFGLIFCILLQIMFLRNLVFFNYAFCFLYIGAVLTLPPAMDNSLYLLIAFVVGILIDTFMNTLGLNAAATVLVAFFRSSWIRRYERRAGEDFVFLSLRRIGLLPFINLFFPLILLHSAALFLIEANSLNLFVHTIIKILASSVYTLVAVLLWQSFSKY